MERAEFEQLVRDALTKLYNYADLETHPLATLFAPPPEQQKGRAEYLRELLLQAIDKLQPPDLEYAIDSLEWRPYIILHKRYVDGMSIEELKTELSLSGRQLRREHARSLRAIATLLWNQTFPERVGTDRQKATGGEWNDNLGAFDITQESLDLGEVMQGLATLFQQRAKAQGVALHLNLPKELPPILSDRVILRQILLNLFSYVLPKQSGHSVAVGTEVGSEEVRLWLQVQMDDETLSVPGDDEDTLEFSHYWCQRLNATLQEIHTPAGQVTRLTLALPRAGEPVALVVDDQEMAIEMYRRYLSQSNLKVVGTRNPEQVVSLARQLQPRFIILDVMMPTMDGWEILQVLQTYADTKHIPVIICSVWSEPELATLLGAAYFLKKPITRKDLLDALNRLGVTV